MPTVIYPDILAELISLGYDLKLGKVLFLTALNSIKMSMISSVRMLGLKCEAVTLDNFAAVIASEDVKILFISPEVMKVPYVSSCLLIHRQSFV